MPPPPNYIEILEHEFSCGGEQCSLIGSDIEVCVGAVGTDAGGRGKNIHENKIGGILRQYQIRSGRGSLQ